MTQLVAKNHTVAELTAVSQINTTAFHFSIAADDSKPLNFTHEYQVAHIDPVGGSHVFSVQLGEHPQLRSLFFSASLTQI